MNLITQLTLEVSLTGPLSWNEVSLTRTYKLLTIFLYVNTFKEGSENKANQSYLYTVNLGTLFFPRLDYFDFIFKQHWKDGGIVNTQVVSGQVRCDRTSLSPLTAEL